MLPVPFCPLPPININITLHHITAITKWQPTKDQCAHWQAVSTVEDAMPLVHKCWGQLANVEHHIYFPLFKSMVIEGIIKKVVTNVLQICTRLPQQGNGVSLLVMGVCGVGKTTIMQGLSKILGKLKDKIVCHYHDYKGTKVPLVDLLHLYLKCKLKLLLPPWLHLGQQCALIDVLQSGVHYVAP
jgi:hypothetical protein